MRPSSRLGGGELIAQRRLPELADAVFGISSTNSKRSGSHHFANCGARKRAARPPSRSAPSFSTTAASGRSSHFSSRDRDHRRLAHRRMRHQRVLEVDRRDPLAARLDHVLRAVLDLDVAARVDRHDVARLEPAVGGPAVGLLGRVVVATRRPTARAPRARPSSRRPTGSRSSSSRARSSTSASGSPASRAGRAASPRRRPRGRPAGATVDASGEVSVMPQPCTIVRPWRCLKRGDHRSRRRRAADEHPFHARQVPACRARVEQLQDRRARSSARRPPRDALSCTKSSSRLSGSRCGPGKTSFAPSIAARYG